MVLELAADLLSSFILGVLTPLTAACVFPLYPAFLVYLSGKAEKQISTLTLGLLVNAGVITFMLLGG